MGAQFIRFVCVRVEGFREQYQSLSGALIHRIRAPITLQNILTAL